MTLDRAIERIQLCYPQVYRAAAVAGLELLARACRHAKNVEEKR